MGFSSPPNPAAFNAQVWEIVRQIPAGKVATYGQIAAMIPAPEGMNLRDYVSFGARWVGGAMAACPEGVPWQRVINAQGKISLRKGSEMQKELLEGEGVAFDPRERVDFARYGWNGPSEDWLKARGLLPPPQLSGPTQSKLSI
ncbi:MAG: 6-O-methylguanine DNA methyltransferase [Chloroflexota bacterium]|nr:MAG: 6-O-methylguanine DNA methyltransferase [Chloroflexota bacterium]